jgi:hypothetical protein
MGVIVGVGLEVGLGVIVMKAVGVEIIVSIGELIV